MSTKMERDLACARSLGEDLMAGISAAMLPSLAAALSNQHSPVVVLLAMEQAVAELTRQMACGFSVTGVEESMSEEILGRIKGRLESTNWPAYRESWEREQQQDPMSFAPVVM